MILICEYACNRFPERSDTTRVQTRASGGAAGHPGAGGSGEGGVNVEDLPECPDHQPSSFLKGKPQSILSLLYFPNINLSPFMLMH